MVQLHPDPPNKSLSGAIAQLGEHRLCKPRVGGSIPPGSTIFSLMRLTLRVNNFRVNDDGAKRCSLDRNHTLADCLSRLFIALLVMRGG